MAGSQGVLFVAGKDACGDSATERQEDDFYPTPSAATVALCLWLRKHLGFDIPKTIWEPACGDGAIASVLAEFGHIVKATDLIDRGFGVGGLDFLMSKPADSEGVDAIFTNPPFNLAEDFIRRAHGHGPRFVIMLLKANYWHAAVRRKLFREFPPAYVLALTWRLDFLGLGKPVMECVWVIWDRENPDPFTRYDLLSKPVEGLFANYGDEG
jgi:hypothetical protein